MLSAPILACLGLQATPLFLRRSLFSQGEQEALQGHNGPPFL